MVFKKSKKATAAATNGAPALDAAQPVKQLDARVGLDGYRDFFTVKNYWKTVNRKSDMAGRLLFHRLQNCRTARKKEKKAQKGHAMGSGATKCATRRSRTDPAAGRPPPKNGGDGAGVSQQPAMDSRLPFSVYRELFTFKNYWKTVRRNDENCARQMFFKYLSKNSGSQQRYERLKHVKVDSPDIADPAFETMAKAYLKLFEDVIEAIESKPADVDNACRLLVDIGKRHRAKVPGMKFDDFQQLEEPFMYMIQIVLEDRFNEKAENLFRKFFQFCLKYILEGFNS